MDTPSNPSVPLVSRTQLRGDKAPTLLTPQFVRLLLVQFAFGLSFSAYFLLPKYLVTELAAGASTIGAASAAALIASVLVSPLLGFALDRFGRRSLLLVGAVVTALTALAMVSVTSVGWWLYAVRIVQGIGFAFVFNAATASAADRAPPARVGHAMGLLGAASLVANAISPAAAEYVAEHWGFRCVFLATAALAFSTLVLGFGVEDVPRPKLTPTLPARTASLRITVISMVTGAAFGTLVTFTQPLALERGAERVAGFFIGYTVAALLVRLAFGNAADRIGRRRVARATLALYGLVTCAAAFIRPGLLEIIGFGFGVAHGLLYPSLAALVAERSDPARHGRALTHFNAAFNAGCGGSVLCAGMAAQRTGYAPVFVTVGIFALLSVPLLRQEPAQSDGRV